MRRTSPVPAHEQPASGRYRFLYKLATGGSGTVYVGQRIGAFGFSRLVAIKRANPELASDPEARETLVREARVASRIYSAHVVAVHDVELTGDEVLLVMDYVPGAALADLLELGRLPTRLAVRVAIDVSSGLRAVHELCDDHGVPLGALHRDVSPENVLIGLDGSVRITDFGLAKVAQTSYASATSLVSGKLAYVAPEILEGGSFGAQSDLFALGVVVWETLSGKRLFGGGDEKETSQRVRTTMAPPISTVAPDLPTEIDHVLERALEKSPRARWESVAAFAEALEAVVRRHDLLANDSELGAHVRSVLGDDRRSALSLARVSGPAGRPAVDFAFVETASLVVGSNESLDDAPTSLRLGGSSTTPAAPWPVPDDPAGAPPVARQADAIAAPAIASRQPIRSARPVMRGAAVVGGLVLLAGTAAVARWGGRTTAPDTASGAGLAPPVASSVPAAPLGAAARPASDPPDDTFDLDADDGSAPSADPSGASSGPRPAPRLGAPPRERASDGASGQPLPEEAVRRASRALAAALTLVHALGAHRQVRAQEKSDVQAAAEAYDAGVQAHRQRDYARAASLFAHADELAPDPAARLAALKSALLADDPLLGVTLAERAARLGVEGALADAVTAVENKFGARVGRLRIVCNECAPSVDGNAVSPGQDLVVLRGEHAIELAGAGRIERRIVHVDGAEVVEVTPAPVAAARDQRPVAHDDRSAVGAALPTRRRGDGPGAAGLSPAWFFAGVGVTLLAGGFTIASGVDVRAREQDFYREPTETKAADGQAAETRTYVLGAVTGAAALTTAAIGVFAVRWRRSAAATVSASTDRGVVAIVRAPF